MDRKSSLAIIIFVVVAVFAVTPLLSKGDKSMSMLHERTQTGINLPSSDVHRSGSFATATFALG
jgi:hypothetical protein